MTIEAETLREEIRRRYADVATVAAGGQQAMDGPADASFGTAPCDDLDGLPEGAGLASLGCGNPIAVADLAPGETVLDLGSGGGIDVLLSAKRVGPTGHAYGLDMTDEMLHLARHNATEARATNVTFLHGQIEQIPLPDASIDVIISNCVINLSTDKPAVFAEMHRVLRNGGRIGISDVVVDNDLDPAVILEQAKRIGCVAGALTFDAYQQQHTSRPMPVHSTQQRPRTLGGMECSCCGQDRDPSMITALQCHDDIKVCRMCVAWLNANAGGIEVTPTLPVADMTAAVRFYETAGFDVEQYDDGFAFVNHNEQSVCNLDLAKGLDPADNHAGCYIITADVDEWHTRFAASGLDVTPVEDMPWGMHEFTLTDPSGNHLRIGRNMLPGGTN